MPFKGSMGGHRELAVSRTLERSFPRWTAYAVRWTAYAVLGGMGMNGQLQLHNHTSEMPKN